MSTLAIERAVEEAFSEALHPRDRVGQWAQAIARLPVGGKLRVGTAGGVKKIEVDGQITHEVKGGVGNVELHANPYQAAVALDGKLVTDGADQNFATDFEQVMAGLPDTPGAGDGWPSQPIDPQMHEYAKVLRADPCAYCGDPSEHIDHIEPVADGGALGWDNLTAACGPCNRRKRTTRLLAYLLRRR